MSVIDVESLLAPVAADAPCGADLRGDPAFVDLREAVKGTPDIEIGNTIQPGAEADWNDVRRRSLALLKGTRDLRVVVYLSLALLKTAGLPGLADGLALLRGLLERHWPHAHPQPDPDDPEEIERSNILRQLSETSFGDPLKVDQRVRLTPIASSRGLGKFSLNDFLVAKGDPTAIVAADRPRPTIQLIGRAMMETPADDLRATHDAAARSLEHLGAIEQAFAARAGASNAPNLLNLKKTLKLTVDLLGKALEGRGQRADPPPGPAPGPAVGGNGGGGGGTPAPRFDPPTVPPADGSGPATGPVEGGSMTTEVYQPPVDAAPAYGATAYAPPAGVGSLDDVRRVLVQACDYFEQHERSSPIPDLLRAAQQLVGLSYADIQKRMPPDVYERIQKISEVENAED